MNKIKLNKIKYSANIPMITGKIVTRRENIFI